MAMISGSLLEVACIYLSRVPSLLRTLAIAEYGYMACSIPSREPSKKGTEAHGIIVSLVDVFGPIKGPNDSWVGLAPYWLTAPTYSERGEQFETYQMRPDRPLSSPRQEFEVVEQYVVESERS
jgi:hypothetical protein